MQSKLCYELSAMGPEQRLIGSFDTKWIERSSAIVLVSNLALLSLSLTQGVLLARWLGPAGKGYVFLAILTASTVAQLLGCSIGQSLQFHLGRRIIDAGTALAFVGLIAILASVTAILGGLLLNLMWPSWFKQIGWEVQLLILSLVVLTVAIDGCDALFVAFDMLRPRMLIELCRASLVIVLIFLLVRFYGRGTVGALESFFIASAFAVGANLLVLKRRAGFDARSLRRALISVFLFGLRQHGATVMARAMKRADSYLLLHFLGPAQVGVYSVAASLAEFPLILARSLQSLIITWVSGSGKNEAERVMAMLTRSVVAVLIPTQIAYAVIVAWAVPVVFGPAFRPSTLPFLILLLSTLCLSIYVLLGGFLSASSQPLVPTYIMSISVACNFALSLLFIPVLGLAGNAIATTSAALLAAGLSLRAFHRISGRGYGEIVLLTPSDLNNGQRALGALVMRSLRGHHLPSRID